MAEPGTDMARVTGRASQQFDEVAGRVMGPREAALVRATQARRLQAEGGTRGQRLDSGMIRGSDLRSRAQFQAARGAAAAGEMGALRGQLIAERRAGERKFAKEHDDARRALRRAQEGLGLKIAETGRVIGGALANIGAADQMRRMEAGRPNSEKSKLEAEFQSVYNEKIEAGYSPEAAYDLTMANLGRSSFYPDRYLPNAGVQESLLPNNRVTNDRASAGMMQ